MLQLEKLREQNKRMQSEQRTRIEQNQRSVFDGNMTHVKKTRAASKLSQKIILKQQLKDLLEKQLMAAEVRKQRDRLAIKKQQLQHLQKSMNKSVYAEKMEAEGEWIKQHRKNIQTLEDKEM